MEQLNVSQKFKNILNDFIKSLKDTYGDGLISVILYGSAASGEFTYKHSNINLLVILNDMRLDNLNKISKLINKHRFSALSPLFFTEDYIMSSTDVFPIEFLDMKENYMVLFGKDVLKDLQIDARNLRFQCEQELKGKLINIKSVYLRNKNKYALRNLMFKFFTSIMHILRNLLRLKGKSPAYLKEDVLNEVSQEFHIDTTNFKKILEAKNKNLRLSYRKIGTLFFNLVEDLEKIVNIVDKL